MRNDIRKRIEAVRRGEVPEGYTRTESGVMPTRWRERFVGDVIEFHGEKSTRNNEFPVLTSSRSGLALQTEYFEGQVTREENAGYNIIPYGFFTYRSRSDDGQFTFNQNTIIDKGIVSCFYPVFCVKEDVAVDKYVLCYLNNYLGRQIIREIVGTSQLVLSEKKLNSLKIILPPTEEQQRIANILSACDRVIDLKQKRVEELKQLKKTCLARMLPREGEDVPELRFPGFTAPWEQRKFYEFAQRESAFQLSSAEFPSVEYEDVVAGEGRLNKDVRLKEAQKTGIVFDGTQVLYGKLRPYLHNWLNPDFSGVAVGDWWVLRPVGVDKEFLYRLIQTQQFDDVANLSSGSKMPRADWNLVSNTDFIIPSSLDEQRQIAEAFDDLDSLITLHQRELEAEQQKKKALMQLLLTGLVRVQV